MEPRRAHSQISPLTVWTVGLNVLLMVGVLALAWHARVVVAWLALALLVTVAVRPLITWLQGRGASHGTAVFVVYGGIVLFGMVFVGSFAPVLVNQGQDLADALPGLQERLRESRAAQWLDAHLGDVDAIRERVTQGASQAVGTAFSLVRRALVGVLGLVTILILSLFMHLFGREVLSALVVWVRPSERAQYLELADRMAHAVGGYTLGVLLISCIGGAVAAVTMLALGVPFFLPIALAAVVLGIIPFLGAWLVGILILATTFATVGGKAALIALGVGLAYQQVENHLLQPLIQRRTMRMNPLIISLVMLLGTNLLGVLGAVLALPFAGALQVVLREALYRRRTAWGERPHPPAEPPAPDEGGVPTGPSPAGA